MSGQDPHLQAAHSQKFDPSPSTGCDSATSSFHEGKVGGVVFSFIKCIKLLNSDACRTRQITKVSDMDQVETVGNC